MAIDETSVIDFVSVDDANNVNLTISDQLDRAEMEMLLQEKINTYCKYVENGQLSDEWFLEKVRSTLEQEGFSFSWGLYSAD